MSSSRGTSRLRRWARRAGPGAITVFLFACVYSVWWWVTASGAVHPIVLPSPSAVWSSVIDIVGRDTFTEHLRTTASEVIGGFAIGAASAVVVAIVCDRFDSLRRLLTPYMIALQAVPKIVLLPLLFVWFGVGFRGTMAMVVLVVFFPIYLNTLTGLASADADGMRLLTSLGASPGQSFRYHRFPSALPLMFTGFKTAVNFAVAAALAAELLGSRYGLGYMISNSGNFLRIDDLYATVVIVTIFAAVFYAVFELLDRKIVFWRTREDQR